MRTIDKLKIHITAQERLWLEAVYKRNLKGIRFTFKEIWSELHRQIPETFRPVAMDDRLITASGEEIKLLGVFALNDDHSIFAQIDQMVIYVRSRMLEDATIIDIKLSEISEAIKLPAEYVSFLFQLLKFYGNFYSGISSKQDSLIFTSINVHGNDATYYQYLRYPGIVKLIQMESLNFFTPKGDTFTVDEIIKVTEKIDNILERVKNLELGQQIIYEDIVSELSEMKGLFFLTKKNWKEVLVGKLSEMLAGGIISETASKRIVEILVPMVNKLLN